MSDEKKLNRILYIYGVLLEGGTFNKKKIIEKFGVSEQGITRDIKAIREFCSKYTNSKNGYVLHYNRKVNQYYFLKKSNNIFTREDVLAITKILLESRAFNKEEMNHLINVVLEQVDSEQQKGINVIIRNELFNYEPLKHNTNLLHLLWDLSEFIRHKDVIEINYVKSDNNETKRSIEPVAIIFSEYYFYLLGNVEGRDYDSPSIFRVDRIKSFKLKGKKYNIPETKRFEDGEFRKRVQFMYAGNLMRIKFEYWGESIDAVLERLPTAKIINKTENKYLLQADVYGKGIIMWILSQANHIKVLEPIDFKEEIKKTIAEMKNIYD
jgi:predicted DNA-binding transcriptional regulator YafY